MPAEVSRRDFLRGAEAIVLATALNRAYAGVSPEDLAGDESFWNKIRSAYVRDPKILNLNNDGVAPTPTVVLDAEIDAYVTATCSRAIACGTIWNRESKRFAKASRVYGMPTPNVLPSRGTPANLFRLLSLASNSSPETKSSPPARTIPA